LNGGGKMLEMHGAENVQEVPPKKLEAVAEAVNSLIVRDFLKDNQDGITDMKQTESWNDVQLFKKTFHYETTYLVCLQNENLIGDATKFANEIANTLSILEIITAKMMTNFNNLETTKREYFEDNDDTPVQRIGETLYFIKCENYMISFGLTEFNLEYMLYRINFQTKYSYFNLGQKALDESPEIPSNEYIWYGFPLELRVIDVQIAYYIHWEYYGENGKVSKKEIDNVIKLGMEYCAEEVYNLVIKYNLTDTDFIWDFLAITFELEDKFELFKRLKKPPFNIALPPNNKDYTKRQNELKKKGLTRTRKDMQHRREIRKETEDAYDKEGGDVMVNGEWVKMKTIYDKSKTNKEVTNYTHHSEK
jgi:hypothetical protein